MQVVEGLEVVEVGHDEAVALGAVEQRSVARSSKLRRFSRPVSGSVDACSWLLAKARVAPMVAPVRPAMVCSERWVSRSIGWSAARTECSTPTAWPRLAIGRHRAVSAVPAASARSRRNWQASSSPLSGKW